MIHTHDFLMVLYVKDIDQAKTFYEILLNVTPSIDLPGMVEFPITDSFRLGLMPTAGISALLDLPQKNYVVDLPSAALKSELYFNVDHPERYLQQAIALGATLISPVSYRNWGERVGYCLDSDGHIIAFASRGNVEG